MRASRTLGLALAIALVAAPAFAVKEWYDHYLLARDRLMPAGKWTEAMASLQEAIRLKPVPAANEQTYGLQFVDYFPYYQLGICYLRAGDMNSAMRYFNVEEGKGAIKRVSAYRDLIRLRAEAESGESQRLARLARDTVERLLKEAAELARAHKYDDALARIAQAQAGATNLDPTTQQRVIDMRDRVRGEQRDLAETALRNQRIEQGLAEGRRLLDDGHATEAILAFDQVLALDPRNARAEAGKKEAQDHIRTRETRQTLKQRAALGRSLFEAGRYEEALEPLTDAATDPANAEARDLLEKSRRLVERMRIQKDLRLRIDALMADADRLLAQRKFPEAWVKLDSVLSLDPDNAKARERRESAQRRTGEDLFQSVFPNFPPLLTFFEPKALEVEGRSLAVVGVATDDRGIVKIEFTQGGRLVGQQVPAQRGDLGEAQRNVRFDREFELDEGANEIGVVTYDTQGESRSETFHVVRRLRIWERRAFFPSAAGIALGLVGSGIAFQRARRRRAVRRRFNPYIAGAPVHDDEMFFGRDKLMARILNVLHHNSLMITGERRIGKTTFMYHLKRALEHDEGTEYRFFPVLTDLQGVPEDAVFHAVMADVVEALELSPDTLAALRFREDGAYDGRDFSHDLQRVVEELKKRTDRKVKLALLIDEVDVLNEYSERINQRLRSIFMKTFSEHLVAIMSGVGIKRAWKSEGSPWYNFFDEIELTPFSREDGEALIRTPVEGIFRFDPEAVERILGASECKPYLIQKYCIHAVNHMLEHEREVVRVDDVEAVRETVHFEGRDVPGPARPVAD
jgi:tetratricopeptide (TPR) repeat protein